MGPKVFISHASEDKQRFVMGFADDLLKNGVEVWLDTWEMLPGDSLVEKVFEGIGNAEAVIIVLSANSINKPWVKEELNASFFPDCPKIDLIQPAAQIGATGNEKPSKSRLAILYLP